VKNPSRPLKQRSEARTRRINEAVKNGRGPVTDRQYGRGLGKKADQILARKCDVDGSLISYWKFRKQIRKKRAEQPLDSMNSEIKGLLKGIIEREGLSYGESIDFGFGDGQSADTIIGPHSAFEPYSGLAWYALEIERVYENCRKQIDLDESGRAAYHAFRLGMLFQEFQQMEITGEFFDQAVAVKLAQKSAGKASQKVPIELRQATYQTFRAKGDKKTIAAQNAACELNISVSTIRNAFGGKLP
jgi:hypothetical protein